jgi:hypothetical protein
MFAFACARGHGRARSLNPSDPIHHVPKVYSVSGHRHSASLSSNAAGYVFQDPWNFRALGFVVSWGTNEGALMNPSEQKPGQQGGQNPGQGGQQGGGGQQKPGQQGGQNPGQGGQQGGGGQQKPGQQSGQR